MALTAPKKNDKSTNPSQYSRLEKLLSFNLFGRSQPKPEQERSDNDFIDIILDADFSRNGKVKNIR